MRRSPGVPARLVLGGSVPALLVCACLLVWQTSQAAFTGSSSSAVQRWTSGNVVLSDDDGGAVRFSATGLQPGSTDTKCLRLTYGGSLSSAVRLYATSVTSTGVEAHLHVTVDEGPAGTFAACGDSAFGARVFSGTLEALRSSSTWASGLPTQFAPSGNGQARTFRLSYTVDPALPSDQRSKTAGATFVWEAQST